MSKEQYIKFKITEDEGVSVDVNIDGILNQIKMVNAMSQAITEMAERLGQREYLLVNSFKEEINEEDYEQTILLMKELFGDKKNE